MNRLPLLTILFVLLLAASGVVAQEVDSALHAAKLKLTAAEATGNREALAQAHQQLGSHYLQKNQPPLAREHYEQCLTYLDSTLQAETWATVHQELGDVYGRMGSFEEALQAYARARVYFQSQQDLNKLGRLSGKVSFVLINQGDFSQAQTKLDEALAFFDRAQPLDSLSLADVCITYGILHSKQTDYPAALDYYGRAAAIYRALDNRQRLMFVYNNMSGAQLAHGNHPKALDYLQQTLRLSEEFDFKIGMMSSLSNIGMIHQTQKDYDQAINYLQRGLALAEEMGDSAQLGRIYNNLGNALQALNKPAEALEHLEKSLKIRQQIGDRTGIASAQLKIGALQTAAGDYSSALEHLEQCRIIWEEVKNEKGMAEAYQYLGELALAQQQYQRATDWCEQGYQIAVAHRLAEELAGTCACLAKAHEGTGHFSKALAYQKQYMSARDSLMNEAQTREITRLAMQYDFDAEKEHIALEQARHEAVLNSQIQRQRLLRNASLGGLAAGLIILLLLGRGYQQKQRTNRLLAKQKDTIQTTLEEREMLLKEIHHRVKNNLQVISSLLSLQSRTIDDPAALDAIEEGRNRVKAMALIHQNLYQEDNLVGVNLPQYIEKLTDSLLHSYRVNPQQIGIVRRVEPLSLDVDTLIPLGLILNELISNALKYAFPERESGNIHIEIDRKEKALEVLVEDDGIGLPPDFRADRTDSMGFKLIRAFVEKMKAQLEVFSQEGTRVRIRIPEY